MDGRRCASSECDRLLVNVPVGVLTVAACAHSFEPTYKYDLESDTFDSRCAVLYVCAAGSMLTLDYYSVKQRTPAWTDRVLWRMPTRSSAAALQVRGVEYASEPALQTSDHRPVRATLALRSGARN
jgi:hypothetical protein